MAFLTDHGVSGEVIVADNGSTDGSQDIARSLGARVVDVPVRGYGLLNLRLALTSPGDRWTAAIFGRNVTDARYFPGLIPAANAAGVVSGTQRIMGAPATYGVSLGFRY